MSVKNSFASTGDLESSTTLITGANITPPPTTKMFAKNSSRHTPSSKCCAQTSNYGQGMPPQQFKLSQNMHSCKGMMIKLTYLSLYVRRVGSKSHSFCATEDIHQLRAHKIEQQFDYEHHGDATSSVENSNTPTSQSFFNSLIVVTWCNLGTGRSVMLWLSAFLELRGDGFSI
eukprot:CCRYP_004113-RA/>CCRYP_004113-RA protein AED:0.84 eAED:1.00 QI:0/-1/0/1/-1/0/1/0/172